jgi:hypothetical protein
MKASPSTLATFLGCAALGAAVTLTLLAPGDTYADGPTPAVQLTAEGTRIGNVVLEGKLVPDAKAKNGWGVLVRAENKGNEPTRVAIATEVTRTVSAPMARVMPMPQAVWSEKETLALAAHQKVERRYEVSEAAAAKLTADARAAEALRKAAQQTADKHVRPFDPMARVLHGVRFLPAV